MQVLQHPHKGFLRGILRVLPLAEHAVTQAEDLPLKPFHQRQHRPLVAGQAAPMSCRKSLWPYPVMKPVAGCKENYLWPVPKVSKLPVLRQITGSRIRMVFY